MKPASKEYQKLLKKATRLAYTALFTMGLALALLYVKVYDPTFSLFKGKTHTVASQVDEDAIVDGIHVRTGFVEGDGLMTVVNNCTNCHSAKLVIQNRMTADRWNATIKWMQETQNLWELGDNQKVIVDYLVQNYPPMDTGRREGLTNISWYELKK